jgi:hypothetical protein
MQQNLETTYHRLRFTVDIEISPEDAKAIAIDHKVGMAGCTTNEFRYMQDAIDSLHRGEYTSQVLPPTHDMCIRNGKYERVAR